MEGCGTGSSLVQPLTYKTYTTIRPGKTLLGGSWVVISRVICRITILITHIRGLITPRRTTHEPPSNSQ